MDVLHELKDGKYTGEIVDITTEETPDGYPKMTWLLKIISGKNDAACVEKKFYLKNQRVIDFLKKELKLIGFEIEGSDELEARKSEIIGTKIEFTAQRNDQGFLVLYAKGAVKGAAKTAVPEKKKKAW